MAQNIFGPFDLMPDQKTMQTSCLGGFFITWVPKLFLTPVKIRIFGPKTAKFGPKYAFLVILAQILAFFALFSMPDQKTMRTLCLGGFPVMWVTKLLISPGKIRIFCP